MIRKHISLMALMVALAGTASAAVQTFRIDPTRSDIRFSVSNLGVNTVHGRFTRYDGQIQYEPGDPTHANVLVTIQTESIDTENEKRDHHLRDKDFFEVTRYPEMTFKSQSIERSGDRYQMLGLLTIKGNTKPVPVLFSFQETPLKNGSVGILAEGETTILRRDFGITYGNAFMVGNKVRIHLAIEAH